MDWSMKYSSTNRRQSEETIDGSCLKIGSDGNCVSKSTFLLATLRRQLGKWRQASNDDPLPPDVPEHSPIPRRESKVTIEGEGVHVESSKLFIKGTQTGQTRFADGKSRDGAPGDDFDWSKVEEVISSTLSLVKRLESDRSDTRNRLDNERHKVKDMRHKIDTKAAERLRLLPALVQREHERCLHDLLELKWHVNFEGRQLKQISDEVKSIGNRNQYLKETIESLSDDFTLLQEKILAQGQEMCAIIEQQFEANEKLEQSKFDFAKSQEKCYETRYKVNGEIRKLDLIIEELNKKLTETLEILSIVQNTKSTITTNIGLAKIKHTDLCNEKSIKEEELRLTLERKKELVLAIDTVKEDSSKLQTEIQKLKKSNKALEAKLKRHCNTLNNEYKQLMKRVQEKTKEMRTMRDNNELMIHDIADMKEQIISYHKKTEDAIKSIESSKKELVKIDKQLQVVFAQTDESRNKHRELTILLKEEEDEFDEEEFELKSTLQSLKDGLHHETKTRIMSQGRIKEDKEAVLKSKIKHEHMYKQLSKEWEETKQEIDLIREEVDKLMKQYNEAFDIEDALKKKMAEINEHLNKLENEFGEKIQQLKPKEEFLSDSTAEKNKRLELLKEKESILCERIKDTTNNVEAIRRLTVETDNIIEKLETEKALLTDKMTNEKEIEDLLRNEYEEIATFSKNAQEKFTNYSQEREKYCEELQSDTETGLADNKRLAAEYESLRKDHMIVKKQYLQVMDSQLILETGIKDLRELKLLEVLRLSYEHRGVSSRNNLIRFKQTLMSANIKVSDIQTQFECVLNKLEQFMVAQNKEQADILYKTKQSKIDLPESVDQLSTKSTDDITKGYIRDETSNNFATTTTGETVTTDNITTDTTALLLPIQCK